MNKRILTVTLNPALDICGILKKDVVRSAGGKGINVARALQGLQTNCLATGFWGGRTGMILRNELKKEGFASDFVSIGEETRTNFTLFDQRNGKTAREFSKSPRISSREKRTFVGKYKKLLGQTSLVVLSGSLPPGLPINFYAHLIEIARLRNIPAILDTSGPALVAGCRANPFAIKPNLAEAEFLWKSQLSTLAKIKRAVEYGVSCGIENVIISLGKQGAVFGCRHQSVWLAAPVVRRPHPSVGCGDALVAGFAAAWQHNRFWEDCCRNAVAAGTASCEEFVPGKIRRDQVRRFSPRVYFRQFSS